MGFQRNVEATIGFVERHRRNDWFDEESQTVKQMNAQQTHSFPGHDSRLEEMVKKMEQLKGTSTHSAMIRNDVGLLTDKHESLKGGSSATMNTLMW